MPSAYGNQIYQAMAMTCSFCVIFQGSQAYTVQSRVNLLEQLFLIGDLCEKNICIGKKAIDALKELESRAINANCIGRRDDKVKIAFLNTQNLINHIGDVMHDHKLLEGVQRLELLTLGVGG